MQYLYDHDSFPKEPLVRSRSSVFAILLLLTLGAATARAQQPVALRYTWTQGDVLTYKMVVRTTSNITGGPQGNSTIDQTMSQTLKISVSAVGPDGTPILRQSIESVAVEINGPMGKMAYDSKKPPADDADPRIQAMAKTFGGLVGEALSVTVASNGTVRRIDGTQRIIDKMMKDLPRDPMAGGMAQNIKQMFSEDALRTSLEQSFSRLPEGPVKPGDTWTSQQSLGADAIGKISGTSTFTLKGIEGSGDAAVARVGVTLALKQDVPPGSSSMSMRLGNAKGEGELLFNIAKGRVERNTMRSEMPSTITMRGPDGGTITMQNDTKTTMTMELVK